MDSLRIAMISNAIGNPELAAELGIDVTPILQQAYPPDNPYRNMNWGIGTDLLRPESPQFTSMYVPEGEEWRPPVPYEQIPLDVVSELVREQELAAEAGLTGGEMLARGADIVTWPLQSVLMLTNTTYEMLRPERQIEPRGDWVERAQVAFGGEEWEGLHPDIQNVLWEPVRDTLVRTGTGGLVQNTEALAGIMLLAGEPELALRTQAVDIAAGEVFTGQPYTGEIEELIHPVERGVRQFVTETAFDPLMWAPGMGGFAGRRPELVSDAERMVNLLEVGRVNPRTGEVLPSWAATTLEGGVRPPTLGERIGWGWNRFHNWGRRITDPHGAIRRAALNAYRYGGADAVEDMRQLPEWQDLISRVSQDTGQSIEQVNEAAVMMLEEVLASDRWSLRNAGSGRPGRLITALTAEEVEIIEAQRAIGKPFEPRPAAPRAPEEIPVLFGEAPGRPPTPRPEVPVIGAGEGAYRTGYRLPRGAQEGFVPGVTEPPIRPEPLGQRRLFGGPEVTPDWEKFMAGPGGAEEAARLAERAISSDPQIAAIDQIMNVQRERFRLGRIAEAPSKPVYEAMTMPQLERTMEFVNNAFIDENVLYLAGVRGFQRAARGGTGMRGGTYMLTDNVIRESVPAFREATNEAVANFAELMYQTSWDSLNVGPRAPLARERIAGILNEPLDSHLGYIKHVSDDAMIDAYIEAAKRSGYSVDDIDFMRRPDAPQLSRNQLVNELGQAIRHESTRQRGFRGSITEGNRLAADRRVWFAPSTEAGELPKLRLIAEGALPGENWVQVEQMFNTDLPALLVDRRLAASRAVQGVNYLDEVMNAHGVYSPTRRPATGTSIYDLQGMVNPKTGKPTAMWTETFGRLSPELQKRLTNTFFADADTAKAVVQWYKISQGNAFIRDMTGIERIFWSAMRPMTQYWKAKTLFPFTAYWLRNWYDDSVRAATWFDGFNSDRVGEAFNTLYHQNVPEHVFEFVSRETGIPRAELMIDDVLYHMRGEGILESGMFYDEVSRSTLYDMGVPDRVSGMTAPQRLRAGGFRGREEGVLHAPWNPFSTNFAWDELGRQFGMDGNNILRLSAAYAGMMEEGMTLSRLGKKVRMVMIDYLDLDPITRAAREFSPFITFQRHAIPLNVRAMFERGARVDLRLRAYDMIDRISTEKYERSDAAPSWNNGRSYRVGSDYWFVPQNFDSMFDLEEILGTFNRLVGGEREAGAELAAEYIGPFYTEPAEQLFNYDLYRGQPIYDRWEGEKVPEFLRDLGLSERGMTHLWHGVTTTWRTAREMEGVYKLAVGEREVSPAWVARRVGGIPIHETDPARTSYFMLRDNQAQLERVGIGREFGTWTVYGIEPDRYEDAGNLFSERIFTHFISQEYLTRDPWLDEERPLVEDIEVDRGRDRFSQQTMIQKIQDDLRGAWALHDRWQQDVLDGRVSDANPPFNEAELDFLSNLNQMLILTKIALAMQAAEEGEITTESARGRIERRYDELTQSYAR